MASVSTTYQLLNEQLLKRYLPEFNRLIEQKADYCDYLYGKDPYKMSEGEQKKHFASLKRLEDEIVLLDNIAETCNEISKEQILSIAVRAKRSLLKIGRLLEIIMEQEAIIAFYLSDETLEIAANIIARQREEINYLKAQKDEN